ncbi:hypothetical protein SPI_07383 [Niveomyces insectorum RCEF 264]|uniref:Uncharacterized protein n=1 Tax=Niveomyces insectorum RCEF 264 TaxID=1081102 RepID=A0A167PT94_9HYPO|nr:hypothetical protein SPI_07383 [Niveomyces insectorum RCEF 264]
MSLGHRGMASVFRLASASPGQGTIVFCRIQRTQFLESSSWGGPSRGVSRIRRKYTSAISPPLITSKTVGRPPLGIRSLLQPFEIVGEADLRDVGCAHTPPSAAKHAFLDLDAIASVCFVFVLVEITSPGSHLGAPGIEASRSIIRYISREGQDGLYWVFQPGYYTGADLTDWEALEQPIADVQAP